MTPNDYSQERARHLNRFQRNRDHCSGIDAVKDAGTRYLPRSGSDQPGAPDYQSTQIYNTHKLRTEYYPAAAHTLQSFRGLVFRKAPVLKAPDALRDIFQTITTDALSIDDLAEIVFDEALITNSAGLLVDHPPKPEGVSVAAAIAGGYRPFISFYRAEAVREITYGVVRNRKAIIKVRLADDEETARHLELKDGVYTVTIHKLINNDWVEAEHFTPMRDGQALNFIPFIPLTTGSSTAPLDDVCALNQTHYIYSADLALALYFYRAPIPVITGVKEDVDISIIPGAFLHFEASDADAKFLSFENKLEPLQSKLSRLEDHMSKIGARLLASEKASAEAAETVARRQASEQSILAGITRQVSRKLQEALRLVAWWLGVDENAVSYSLNVDFVPTPMTPTEVESRIKLVQAGFISAETLFALLKDGEVIPDALDYETEKSRIEMDQSQFDPPIDE